jgi:hypothetical protein
MTGASASQTRVTGSSPASGGAPRWEPRPEVKGSAIGAQASASRSEPARGGGFGANSFERAAQQSFGGSAARAATGALQRMSPRPSRPPSVPQSLTGRATGQSRTLSPAALSAFAGSPKGKEPKDLLPSSRRRYPRADIQVKARLLLAGDHTKFFEAALPTSNISVGGMFLESTFFLKTGTLLEVHLELPPGRKVRVKATVVRVESSETESGFALRFTEYLDGSEVILATHFLSPVLREFLLAYSKQHQFDASPEYLAHTADVLAAWELRKAELGGDVWNLVPRD